MGKISSGRVRAAVREIQALNNGRPIARSMGEITAFFEAYADATQERRIRKFCGKVLDFRRGKITEEEMREAIRTLAESEVAPRA